MIKVFDTNYNFLDICYTYKDIYTMESLSTGLKTLCFQAPCLEHYINLLQEEFYIETEDYNYIIKEVNYNGNDFFTVYASADVEDIGGSTFMVFDFFEGTIRSAYEYCLQNTPWIVDYHSEKITMTTYQLANTDALTMLRQIATDYRQELWFDTKNKILHVYDTMGKAYGDYYSNELKLKNLNKQSSSYNYATVLFPIGKDGITIENINNGLPFIENFNYSDKYIEKIWVNEDYDIPEKLKAAAEIYLDEIAQPKASYKLKLSDLGPNIALGDNIILIDKIKKIKQKQRVVKITRYLEAPENDTIELSNLQEDFARSFVNEQKNIRKEIAYIKSVINELR